MSPKEALDFFTPLKGFRVVVSYGLRGAKKAVKQGDTVYISPAMHELLKNANAEEMMRLLSSIQITEIPEYKPGLSGVMVSKP